MARTGMKLTGGENSTIGESVIEREREIGFQKKRINQVL